MTGFKPLVAIAALSLVGKAQAWYNDLPSCLEPFQPFVYTGCYDNGQPGQPEALSLRTDLDQQNMTVETCVAHCKGNDFRLAGLSYYGVCYCGQTVSTALLPEDQCSFPCTGNSSETCGGNSEINIWMDPTFPPLPSHPDVSEYVSVGCWTDDSSQGKALFYRQDNVDGATMTTNTCLQSCLNSGFPFAGTEYGGECYCGVVVGNGTSLAADQTTCNVPCNGDASEICGGPARLSLYIAKDLQSLQPCGTPPDTSSSVTVPPTSSSTTPPPPPDTSTTPPPPPTSTSSGPVCTTTVVTPPPCEYGIGNWCSDPLPDWDDEHGCSKSWSKCKLQCSSCYQNAGFPASLNCHDYENWCDKLEDHCRNNCKGEGKGCRKPDFEENCPPSGGGTPVTSTSTYPCPTTMTTATSTQPTDCPTPTPTVICIQPTGEKYNYGPGHPVGGIELPVVTCNDNKHDWDHGNVYKMYNDKDSDKCPSYPRGHGKDACHDACETQFKQCKAVYAQGCKTGRVKNSYGQAMAACAAQHRDCLAINRNIGDDWCNTWDDC